MIESDYAYQKIDASVTIDGDEIPATGFQIDYELNSIPRAVVSVPTGRDAETMEPSPISSLFASSDRPKVEIHIRCRDRAGDAPDFGIPEGESVKVFEGYYSGPGFSRSQREMRSSFRFAANGWLGEIDYSSIFSRWSHPSNPGQYSSYLIHKGTGTGAASEPSYWGPYDPTNALRESNVSKDLWGATLLPFFRGLADADGLAVPEQGFDSSGLKNDAAAAVLARIKAPRPLALDLGSDATLDTMIREYIQAAVSDPDAMAARTFWDVLVSTMAGSFLFAVVPRVDDALIVPFSAAARPHVVEFDLDSFDSADLSGRNPRPIAAVGIVGRYDASTGLNNAPSSNSGVARQMVGGWYRDPDVEAGMVHLEAPPPWASSCVPATRWTAESVGAFGGRIGLANSPKAAGAPKKEAEKKAGAGAKESQGFLEKFARTRMAQIRTVDRQGTIGGPLRLDVAPGTSCRIVVGADPGVGGVSAIVHGTVVRTSIAVDIPQKSSRTSFQICHVRTASENESDPWAVDSHPLYKSLFVGAGLTSAGSPSYV